MAEDVKDGSDSVDEASITEATEDKVSCSTTEEEVEVSTGRDDSSGTEAASGVKSGTTDKLDVVAGGAADEID